MPKLNGSSKQELFSFSSQRSHLLTTTLKHLSHDVSPSSVEQPPPKRVKFFGAGGGAAASSSRARAADQEHGVGENKTVTSPDLPASWISELIPQKPTEDRGGEHIGNGHAVLSPLQSQNNPAFATPDGDLVARDLFKRSDAGMTYRERAFAALGGPPRPSGRLSAMQLGMSAEEIDRLLS